MSTTNAQNEAVESNENVAQQSNEQASVEQDVQALLVEAQAQAAQHFDSLLRLQADMENLRRRTEREIDNAKKFALERFVNDLIQIGRASCRERV